MKKLFCLLLILNLAFSSTVYVKIPKGASASSVSRILKENKIINSELKFKLLVKVFNKEHTFIPGRIKLNPDTSYLKIIDQLQNPQNVVHAKVTIPEGYNLFQIDDLLVKKELISKGAFYAFATNRDQFLPLLKSIPELYNEPEITKLEGFLFPDTYMIDYDMTIEEMVHAMLMCFKNKALPAYELSKQNGTLPRRNGTPLKLYNIISLASIVEEETTTANERAMVAGVFLNRMNRNMTLGSCPTIHYARKLEGLPRVVDLSFTDTRIENAYNTYIYSGLPPTPISNPGIASIEAALNPGKHNYLFFVSNKDGTHHFSRTEREHINWTKKYYHE